MKSARAIPLFLSLVMAACASPETADDAGTGTGGTSSEGGDDRVEGWHHCLDDDSGTTTDWPTMKTPMQNLYNAQMSTLNACP